MIEVELEHGESLRTLLPRLYAQGGVEWLAGQLRVNSKTAARWLSLYNVPRRRWMVPPRE